MNTRMTALLEKVHSRPLKLGALKSILRGLLRFMPSFQGWGLYAKISLTVVLAGICSDLFYAKMDQAIPIIKGMLSFSPAEYAEKLLNEKRPKPALDYIEFYESIPGTDAAKLASLKTQAENMRSLLKAEGAKYHAGQAWKGIKGEKGDEIYTTVIDQGVDFLSIGDLRDLYKEINNYRSGGEVDKLNASMAATGLAMTLGEIASGGTMATVLEPVKKSVNTFSKALKVMNVKMRKSLGTLLEPLAKTIRKSGAIEGLAKLDSISAVKDYVLKHKATFTQLADDCAQSFKKIDNFTKVAISNPKAAALIAKNADSIGELNQFSKVAQSLADNGAGILKYGRKEALEAAVALEKKGQLNPATLKKAMGYGEKGLKAVKRGMNIEKLAKKVEKLRKSFVLMKLFFIQWLLSRIPWILALLVEIFLLLVIFKTWFWRSLADDGANRA